MAILSTKTDLAHADFRTLSSLFFAFSEERRDLGLVEAIERLFSLGLSKVKAGAAGIIAEDAIMKLAINMLQTGKRLMQTKDLITNFYIKSKS